jgi:hypothetical protein
MSRERRRAQVMLASLALVGVVAVGAAAPSSPASPVLADESMSVSAVGEVEAADDLPSRHRTDAPGVGRLGGLRGG